MLVCGADHVESMVDVHHGVLCAKCTFPGTGSTRIAEPGGWHVCENPERRASRRRDRLVAIAALAVLLFLRGHLFYFRSAFYLGAFITAKIVLLR